jgi:cytochrome c
MLSRCADIGPSLPWNSTSNTVVLDSLSSPAISSGGRQSGMRPTNRGLLFSRHILFLAAVCLAIACPAAQGAEDVAAGAKLFHERCTACHSANPTRKPGPELSNVFGRPAGSVATYHYSDALKSAHLVWNETTLDRWLASPPTFIPGVNMQAFVADPADRKNLIAYLRSLDTPHP